MPNAASLSAFKSLQLKPFSKINSLTGIISFNVGI